MAKRRPPRGRKSKARRPPRSEKKPNRTRRWLPRTSSNSHQAQTLKGHVRRGTHHDIESHFTARATFLNLIYCADPDVAKLFQWGGVLADSRVLADRGDELAARVGLQHRGQLLTEEFGAPADARLEWQRDREAFWTTHHQHVTGILPPVEHLVFGTWKLPWSWLVFDLANAFYYQIRATLLNTWLRFTIERETPVPPEPDADEAERQRAWQALVQHKVAGRRRGVRPTESAITRDVEWFYLHLLRHEKTSDLARKYGKDRKTVRDGIERATYLLGEVPAFTYKPD